MVFVLLVVGLVALPFVQERWRSVMGAAKRESAPGTFVKLSQGITHYSWHGPTRGPVVVAVHGLTTASPVWNDVASGLALLGYRVLTYDLFGRGYSDAPEGAHDTAFYTQQLADLLAAEDLTEDVTLMGYSMGGSIVSAFASENTHMIQRVVLVAPAGLAQNESTFSRVCRRVPVVGDWLFALCAPIRMRSDIMAAATRTPAPITSSLRADMGRRGYFPAVLASRRGILAQTFADAHRAIGKADVPVLAIWGGADPVIPLQSVGLLAQWNRTARQDVIEGADHGLPYTHASDVVSRLRRLIHDPD